MTDSTAPSFHTAPPGWVAIYRGELAYTRVPVAGFVYDPRVEVGTAGIALVCDPESGILIEAPEYGRQNGLRLARVEVDQPAKPYGPGNPSTDMTTSIVNSLGSMAGSIESITSTLDDIRHRIR